MDVLRALGAEIVRTPTEAKFDSPGRDTVVFLEATKVNSSTSTKSHFKLAHAYLHMHLLGHVTTVYSPKCSQDTTSSSFSAYKP